MNDRHACTWACTPADLEPLAAGWLLGEGFISDAEQIQRLEAFTAERRVIAEIAGAVRDPGTPAPLQASAMSGAAGSSRVDSVLERMLDDGDRLRAFYTEMFERAALSGETGGMHAGALIADGAIRAVAEDVGRHNVVDRLLGRALLDDCPRTGSILLLSSRISAAIAAKAGRGGVAAVVSISIPTTLARDVAARAGIALVGRARRGVPQVHLPRRPPDG